MLKIISLFLATITTVLSVEDPVVVDWIKRASDPWQKGEAWEPLPIAVKNVGVSGDAPAPDEKGAFNFGELENFVQSGRESTEIVGLLVKLLGRPGEFGHAYRVSDREWIYEGKVFIKKGNKLDPAAPLKEYGTLELEWSAGTIKAGAEVFFPHLSFKPFD